MIVALLALYPRSWLDWVVLVRLCFGAVTYMEATTLGHRTLLQHIQLFQGEWITSSIRLLAVVALILMCIYRRWGFRSEAESANVSPPVLQPQ
jgi:hypothetical protein